MKIRLNVSSESSASARQRIHMKNQALFSSNDKSKNLNVVYCMNVFSLFFHENKT